MALVPLSGSSTVQSFQKDVDSKTLVDRTDIFDDVSHVRDSFVQRTVFNQDQYNTDAKLLNGYLTGTRLSVIYYHKLDTETTMRGGASDGITTRSPHHDPLIQINSFEITVDGDFQRNFVSELRETEVSGSGFTYPGFNPVIGDIFFADMADGRIGAFFISEIEPLSYFAEKTHRVNFYLKKVVDEQFKESIEARVVRTAYFDKTIFLKTKQLLIEDDYTIYKTLVQMKPIILTYHYKKFYDKSLNSLVRPDGVYDPYVIKFLQDMSDYTVNKIRADQLCPDLIEAHYASTIWGRMHDTLNTDIDEIAHHYTIEVKRFTFYSSVINALINRAYLKLNPSISDETDISDLPPEIKSGYVFSDSFYKNDITSMSDIENIVYEALTTRDISHKAKFISMHLNTYKSLTKEQKFYLIPVYIFLINICLYNYTVARGV